MAWWQLMTNNLESERRRPRNYILTHAILKSRRNINLNQAVKVGWFFRKIRKRKKLNYWRTVACSENGLVTSRSRHVYVVVILYVTVAIGSWCWMLSCRRPVKNTFYDFVRVFLYLGRTAINRLISDTPTIGKTLQYCCICVKQRFIFTIL